LLKEVERINKQRIDHFVEKLRRALWVLRDKQIGVLGLAFKANTDDIRFAPAVELVQRLQAEGAHVRLYDPEALERAKSTLKNVQFCENAYDTAQDADVLVIATEWDEFRTLEWERLRDLMAHPLILDGRNLLQPAQMRALGFEYHSMGRPDPGSRGTDGRSTN